MNYNDLTRSELLDLVNVLSIDRSFEIMKKEACIFHYDNISDGEIVLFIDLCNVHAANHKYSMAGYDRFVRNVTRTIRESDIIAKFGGDELVIILRSTADIKAFVARLITIMAENNIYAVIACTTSYNGLVATVEYLDKHVSYHKLLAERTGSKPDRSKDYECLASTVVYC